ncbi:histidine kinase [Aquibacillus kalidii]|uniref:histidine kinase n=1 Tax=Aquibacillus kalidii TaxID=2762597 RepID=UPI0016494A3E|nr:histidine kinase [Aquibacillus kalidii]
MGKLKFSFYLSSVLLIVIPISIVLMTDVPFHSSFSHIVIGIAFIIFTLGKSITIFEKRKEAKSFAKDVGAIIGLSIGFIAFLLSNLTI